MATKFLFPKFPTFVLPKNWPGKCCNELLTGNNSWHIITYISKRLHSLIIPTSHLFPKQRKEVCEVELARWLSEHFLQNLRLRFPTYRKTADQNIPLLQLFLIHDRDFWEKANERWKRLRILEFMRYMNEPMKSI